MKKIALVAVLVFALLCPLAAGENVVTVSESESLITFSLTLDKPKQNVIYSNEMPVNFSIQTHYKKDPMTLGVLGFWIGIQIDNGTIYYPPNYPYFIDFLDITKLSDGLHNFTIHVGSNYMISNTIFINARNFTSQFLVSNTPPKVQILSPQNTTYYTSEVPLTYELFLPSTFSSYFVRGSRYSLDNQANQTVGAYHAPVNGTLTNLTDGTHSLTVYGIFRSLETSDTVYFTIDTKSSPTPTATIPEFPVWMILPLAIATALTAIIVIRNKKQKQS